jgi:hypothetical protein
MLVVMAIFFAGHTFVQAVINPIDNKDYDQLSLKKFDRGAIYEYTNKEEFCHR